jgi:hypothetical protein
MKSDPFFVEQFVEPRLGNSAYLAGSHASQRAALIDPLRDVDQYHRSSNAAAARARRTKAARSSCESCS